MSDPNRPRRMRTTNYQLQRPQGEDLTEKLDGVNRPPPGEGEEVVVKLEPGKLTLKGGEVQFITGSGDLQAQPSQVSGSARISLKVRGNLTGKGEVTAKEIEAPCKAIDRFLSIFLSSRFYKRVVERRIADWQWEYHEAKSRAEGRSVLAWIWVRNFGELLYVLLRGPVTFLIGLLALIDRLKP